MNEFMMTPDERLECDIEESLARYLGTDYPIPTDAWADIAREFARAVRLAHVSSQGPDEASQQAKELVGSIGMLVEGLAAVVE